MKASATRALVVEERRLRRVDDERTSLPDLEAEIDVVENDSQAFVEAANLVEDAAWHHHARAGNRAAVACEIGKAQVARRLSWPRSERIGGHAIDPDDHAGMLYTAIAIEQPRSHRANLWPLCVLEHRRQPVGMNDLDVVVQEEQLLAARMRDAEVVDRRVIERLAPLVYLAPWWQ